MFTAKNLLKKLGKGFTDYEIKMHGLVSKNRSDYIFNSTIEAIEMADHCLLINTNPRYEAAVLNARIRKSIVHNDLKVAFIGPKINLNYNVNDLGENTLEILQSILNEKHQYCEVLKSAKKPMMIIGSTTFSEKKANKLHNLCKQIARKYNVVNENWNGFNILHFSAGAVGALDVGFVNYNVKGKKHHNLSDFDTVILLGADDISLDKIRKNTNVVYIGHHGDNTVYRADIILPSPAYVEKSGTYVNTEGRFQKALQAVNMLGDAKPEYETILNIANNLDLNLDFVDFDTLQKAIINLSMEFENIDSIKRDDFNADALIENSKFNYPIDDFYRTDSISRSSKIMNECYKANFK
jgi:NADH-quinone oxidoreductase subunit G